MLERLRCIQLDPIDRIGSNAELVALARVDGLRRSEIYTALLPGHAFEHFAKERCLLPARAFPHYREQARRAPHTRLHARLRRVPAEVLHSVLEEVGQRGPVGADGLRDRGRIEAIDYSGWQSTSRAATMALQVLTLRCQLVVAGRPGRSKHYDLPERALPEWARASAGDSFARWALAQRVEAAGLLSLASGPQWGMLAEARRTGLAEQMRAEGSFELVRLPGSRRAYLAPAGFLDRSFGEEDGRMRILAPLDPLLWDRKLVQQAFGFEYIWEVYKPASQRRWGYYVCPLLHRGRLVGRFEGRLEAGELVVSQLWKEPGVAFDTRAWRAARERHARVCGR